MTGIYARQLPVRFPPCVDELLSSWIIRHAAFYAISPLAMLRSGHDPPHDFHEYSAIVTAADCRRASAIMQQLSPNCRRVAHHSSKPTSRLADHLPALRRSPSNHWWA